MLKTITIEDFSGGKNIYDDQALIENNQAASATYSVWAPQRLLTKTPGTTEYLLLSASAGTVGAGIANWNSLFVDDAVNTAFTVYHRLAITPTSVPVSNPSFSGFVPWAGQTDSLTPLGYTTGTCSITSGSQTAIISATGQGTLWLSNITSCADYLAFNATSSAYYSVLTVDDDTHLTIAGKSTIGNAPGVTAGAYKILTGFYGSVGTGSTGNVTNASLNGSIYSFYQGQSVQRYDSTGMTRLTSAPNATYCDVYQNYLFAANTVTAQSRLYWSAVRNGASWPTNNFIDVDVNRGVINAIFSTGNELLVFKSRSLFKVVGSVFDPANPTYAVYPIAVPNYYFFNSFDSISMLNGLVYFFGQNRIYVYRPGTFYITDISQKIWQDLPNTFSSLSNAAGADARVRGRGFGNYYFIKGLTYQNSSIAVAGILDHNKAWWLINDKDVVQPGNSSAFDGGPMAVIPGTASKSPVIIMASVVTSVRLMNFDMLGPSFATSMKGFNNSGGAANADYDINSQWVSKEFNIQYGTFKWAVVYLKKQTAGTLSFQWSIDQAAYVSNTIDMTLGRGTIIRSVLPIMQKGTSIQLKITHNTISQTFAIYGIKIIYEESPMERLL